MIKYVIGLMSGTSLDGLDIVYVQFDTADLKKFEIIKAQTINYNNDWRKKLKTAYDLSANDLALLDVDFGQFMGEQIKEFIRRNGIERVDLIASHGQTVFHRPEAGYTTQIGSGAHINALTKIKTICDFRTQDVALGGQGAPLVPIGDQLLFGDYDYCLNIGGFANISFEKNSQRIAFDISPANIVLNHYVANMGYAYDDGGEIARSGKLNQGLLEDLNHLDFYQDEKPKSLGWEFVTEQILPLIDSFRLPVVDILRTYTEHTAMQIGRHARKGKMLVTGGGAYHLLLIERIRHYSSADVIVPEPEIIDYKEALIFALLGLLKEQNQVNVLSSVTGSPFDHSSGIIYDIFQTK